MPTSAFSLLRYLDIHGRKIMWKVLFVWIWLSYMDCKKLSASDGISLCLDTCNSAPEFGTSKEMNTFVCHFNRKREQNNGIYVEYKKNDRRSQLIGVECLITTKHVEPWCVLGQCRAVSSKGKQLPGDWTPGQYDTDTYKTRYICTRQNIPNLSRCTKRKVAGTKERAKARTTVGSNKNTNNDNSRKKIPKKPTSTKVTGYKTIKVGTDRMLVKQYHMNKTWDQAFKKCVEDGAHLIKLDTKYKMRAIRSLNLDAVHWIGMKDLYDNDRFLWIDRAPLRFKGWCTGQPSHWSQEQQKENCVEVGWCVLGRIAWNDRICNDTLPFICQK